MIVVQFKIELRWAAFVNNKLSLISKHVSYHIKSKIYNTYVLPVVLYGCECANWTSTSLKKIKTFQNHMRFMTNHKLSEHKISRNKVNSYHIHHQKQGSETMWLKWKKRPPTIQWRNNVHKWTNFELKSLNTAISFASCGNNYFMLVCNLPQVEKTINDIQICNQVGISTGLAHETRKYIPYIRVQWQWLNFIGNSTI